jgi:hypothetical protein
MTTVKGFDGTQGNIGGPFYRTSDCSGTAYRFYQPPSPTNVAVTPLVVGPRASVFVYSGAPAERFTPLSTGAPGACNVNTGTNAVYDPQTHVMDLYDWFTPPFSLQVTTF